MPDQRHPNVILFLADDLGYGDLACHGNPTVNTSHLDAFARESVEWERFYVSPVCSPTRASIMTGRYSFRSGVTDVVAPACEMDPAEITLAQRLKAAGYATGLFGKWHLGDAGPHRPPVRGFDEALTFHGHCMTRENYFNPTLFLNDEPRKYDGYCMDVFTDAAIDFVRRRRAEPFFLAVPTNLIHIPLVAPDHLLSHYDDLGLLDSTRTVYAMIESLDQGFGRLLAAVEEAGIADDTLIVALSDNGPCHSSDPVERFMAGLHGLKGTPYENGIRVPCFMRWPRGFFGGTVRRSIAAHIDLMPTILDACGLTVDSQMDGRTLLPMLRDPSLPGRDRNFVFQWDSSAIPRRGQVCGVVGQRWKLVQPCGSKIDRQHHIFDQYRQLCQLQGRGDRSVVGPPRWELYDIAADPGETNDLARDNPQIVRNLREFYDAWFDDVTARWK